MKKAQAALFDGIMLMAFASLSIAMLYGYLGTYGTGQDTAMRSSYVVAYINQVGKTIFFLDAKALSSVALNSGPTKQEALAVDPEYKRRDSSLVCPSSAETDGCPYADLLSNPGASTGCGQLANFQLLTVSDLLKKDLGDSTDQAAICLDDQFGITKISGPTCYDHAGTWTDVPVVPGKTALRCAMMEMMKPFEQSGYKYFVDVLREQDTKPVPQPKFVPGFSSSYRITDDWRANIQNWASCDDAVLNAETDHITSVNIPFRVTGNTTMTDINTFMLRICIWPTRIRR